MRAIDENKPPAEWSTKMHALYPEAFRLKEGSSFHSLQAPAAPYLANSCKKS